MATRNTSSSVSPMAQKPASPAHDWSFFFLLGFQLAKCPCHSSEARLQLPQKSKCDWFLSKVKSLWTPHRHYLAFIVCVSSPRSLSKLAQITNHSVVETSIVILAQSTNAGVNAKLPILVYYYDKVMMHFLNEQKEAFQMAGLQHQLHEILLETLHQPLLLYYSSVTTLLDTIVIFEKLGMLFIVL